MVNELIPPASADSRETRGRIAPLTASPLSSNGPLLSAPTVVTAVIPTHNRPRLVRRAVSSALAQINVEIEVIVVDDDSRPALDASSLADEVIVLRQRGGVAKARNLAVRQASGDWIAFLDDDDAWAPDHVHRVLCAVRERNAEFGYSSTVSIDLTGGPSVVRPAPEPAALIEGLLRGNAIGTPSCVMMRRSLFDEVGGFDPELSVLADWDLWIRMATVACGATSRAATAAYTIHAQNMSSNLPQLLREFEILKQRYGARCAEGWSFGEPSMPRWMAELYRRQHAPCTAARWYLRSAKFPGRRTDAVRAVGVLLGERVMRWGRHGARHSQSVRPAWLRDLTDALNPSGNQPD